VAVASVNAGTDPVNDKHSEDATNGVEHQQRCRSVAGKKHCRRADECVTLDRFAIASGEIYAMILEPALKCLLIVSNYVTERISVRYSKKASMPQTGIADVGALVVEADADTSDTSQSQCGGQQHDQKQTDLVPARHWCQMNLIFRAASRHILRSNQP